MDLNGAFRAVRKYWWVVAGVVALSAIVGIAITVLTPPKYASTVTFFVRTPAEQIGGAYQGDQFAQKRVNSYVQLAGSQRLASLVRVDLQSDLTDQQISEKISARGDLNTVLLTLTVTDVDAARSLDIARSLSSQFVQLVSQIETPPGSAVPSVSLEVTSQANLAPDPVAPRPIFNVGLALIVGLILGIALALLREFLDKTVRSVDGLKRLTDSPVLAVIPYDNTAKASPLIVESHAKSIRAEAFRQLRTNLQFVDVDRQARVIVVTSSVPNEGKSSTATNLAVAFAEAEKKVLLIEADLRRPRVADYLGLEGSVGLTNVLAGQVPLDDVLQPWGKGGLTVLPSGSIPPNPSELLGSQNMRELLTSLRATFEVVIIDTPPLLPVTDGAIAAAGADGAILVVRHGATLKAQLTSAKSALEAVDARLLGTVMNMAPVRGAESYGYGREYRYDSDPASSIFRVEDEPHSSSAEDSETEKLAGAHSSA